jgi:type I restriction enzyme S subunit
MNHKTVLPKLRFQQFAGKWCLDQLDAVVDKKISYGIVQAGEHVENGMPYIKSQNLNTEINLHELQRTSDVTAKKYQRSEVKPGDIVFSLRGNIGISRIVPESIEVANLTQGTARISVSNLFYNRFINFSLQTNFIVKQVSEVSKGSTFQEISLEALRKIKIHIPTLPEQQKIASFLSVVDEKIQQLSRKKELLEQYKKGLMQQLFSGKLRFKDENGNDYADWEEKKLGEVCESIKSGKSNSSEEGNFPLYGSTGIIGKCIEHSHEGLYILIARVGANAGTINLIKDRFGVSDNTIVLDCNQNSFIDYLFYYLGHYNLNRLVFGSGQPLITGGQLKVLKLNLPSFSEQQKTANFLSSIDAKIESVNQQINQTQSFKKGLLQQLFV